MKSKYLIAFMAAFLLGVAITFGYLFLTRSPRPVTLNPVLLEVTGENHGRRCEARLWDDASDNPVCYKLQAQLNAAADRNDLNGIRKALKRGANVNGSYYNSDAPLMTAVTRGHKEAVKLLLENGADINRVGKWNSSPLQKAAFYNQTEIAEILLENGADVCHRARWDNGENPTALDIARKNGNGAILALLVSFGAVKCYVPW